MTLIVADRVLETTTTTGAGTLTLGGAVAGYQAFSDVCANADTAHYAVWEADAFGVPSGDWETGLGTWATGGTLARTSVGASSNGGAAVDFAAGTKRVALAGTAQALTMFPSGIVVEAGTNVGIKIDTDVPTFGWRDITTEFNARTTGPQVPSLAAYNSTSVYQYQFSNGATQELFVAFHIPHDYVPGSELFIHIHWSQTTVDSGGTAGVPGAVKWSFDALYAKGFNQQAFPAAVTNVFAVQTAASTARQHMIAEVQLTTSGALGGNDIEVDGIILVRVFRAPADAADTLNVAPFAHFCDLHYQSTNLATKNKAPSFYG